MNSFDFVVTDPVGIHARPAGILAKKAKAYASKICINFNGKTADVTRLMAVMGMGIKQGNTINVTVEGDDEETTAAEIEQFFKDNF